MNDFYAIIMAGGVGSRFWPFSRNDHPKQFIDILGTGESLLQMTFRRFEEICPMENIYIVTNEQYGELVKAQLPDINEEQILAEPIKRNTAPCIAYACHKIYVKNPNATVVVTPSDHLIYREKEFIEDIRVGLEEASGSNKLITLGIQPNRPETGYGYIQYIPNEKAMVKRVKTFTEKPHLELAQTFIDSGDFVWNAGIFIWSIPTILKAFETYLPDLSEIFEEARQHFYSPQEKDAISKAYSMSKNISIDYGIMEKASDVYVVLGDFGWSDLGSWASLHELKDKDESKNVIDGNALVYDSRGCYIKGDQENLIVVDGLEDYLVANTGSVLLICPLNAEKRIREFVNDVKLKKSPDYL